MHHDFSQILSRFSLCCYDVCDGVCVDAYVAFYWVLARLADFLILLLLQFLDLLTLSLVLVDVLAQESRWREAQLPLDSALPQIHRYNRHCNRHHC